MKFPKFKLPPNSLFAVLLRSRWWISILIGAVLSALALAALPAPYGPMGAMGSFPFWGIGVVALFRQWKLPSAKQRAAALARLQAMNTREFTALLEKAYAADGYSVRPANLPGADLHLVRQGSSTLVAARRFKASSLGAEPLRELSAAMTRAEAGQGMVVAMGSITEQARRWADAHAIRILETDPLIDWLYRMKQL